LSYKARHLHEKSALAFQNALRVYDKAIALAKEIKQRFTYGRNYGRVGECEEIVAELSGRFHQVASWYAHSASAASRNEPIGSILNLGGIKFVPVVGAIVASNPAPTLYDIEDYMQVLGGQVSIGENEYDVFSLRGARRDELKLNPEEYLYFVVRVEGDSMNRAGIQTGDYVLIQRPKVISVLPTDRDIVAAVVRDIDDKATLKRFVQRDSKLSLQPESKNASHKPHEFTQRQWDDKVEIIGTAIAMLKKM
jgi:SOS-response transcriptional repressor LexA